METIQIPKKIKLFYYPDTRSSDVEVRDEDSNHIAYVMKERDTLMMEVSKLLEVFGCEVEIE